MASITALLESIQTSAHGLTLAELLARRPDTPRRTAQRWIQQLIREGVLTRYVVSAVDRTRMARPPGTRGNGRLSL